MLQIAVLWKMVRWSINNRIVTNYYLWQPLSLSCFMPTVHTFFMGSMTHLLKMPQTQLKVSLTDFNLVWKIAKLIKSWAPQFVIFIKRTFFIVMRRRHHAVKRNVRKWNSTIKKGSPMPQNTTRSQLVMTASTASSDLDIWISTL